MVCSICYLIQVTLELCVSVTSMTMFSSSLHNMSHDVAYICNFFLILYVQSGVPGSGDIGGAAVMRGPMAGRVVTQL